ncbi:GNAT family N-acetyltransferase [Actinotalea fermentans]|uniref:UPF0256 protein n=1 Tax=Actinotalea fermentans TaxID=43671 RepID=A0A511YW65_9CELL|nr:GNAT family N-acetyltransferase [Actinotalea fermentans]KGM16635.1 acetyltransferase [Actinotalea fermentans ATCC 43279 = JCM 9966 = DSM 3133]GEN79419.1 UPF0256 protein [Actinotalea fermentans]
MTPVPDGYRAVDLSPARLRDVLAIDTWAFPSSVGEDKLAELPTALPWSRAGGVEAADGELVGMYAAYPYRSFPVPGARIPLAGLTWVGVHPGHRRRGILRTMIDRHFAQAREAGEAVAALFAAEPAIYGRFGYGLAARDLRLSVPRGAALRDVPGADALRVRLEKLDAAKHGPVLHAIHSAVDRPGWATRETDGALEASLADPEFYRDGAESLRIALVEDADGTPRGYAKFRRKDDWKPEGPRGVVRVREAVAQDAATARALWGVLLDLDLMASVEVGLLALDDPLWFLLVDPRAARPAVGDNLWVRVLDVPAALAQRRYAAPVDVVLEVTDALWTPNAGRWRLVAGPDGAEVTRTDADADLALDVRELGTAYLGGFTLAALAGAGLVTELRPGTLHAASTAFGWPVAPVSSYVW